MIFNTLFIFLTSAEHQNDVFGVVVSNLWQIIACACLGFFFPITLNVMMLFSFSI